MIKKIKNMGVGDKCMFIMLFVFVGIPLMTLSLSSCVEPPKNKKTHKDVKITVLDAYYHTDSNGAETRLIAMTSIRPYPVIINVSNTDSIIDELTLYRMFKTVNNFTFKASVLYEDLSIENSMAYFMYGSDIVLFPNNNIELKNSDVALNTDDMSPIMIPSKNISGRNNAIGTHIPAQGGASASNSNTFTINVNGEKVPKE